MLLAEPFDPQPKKSFFSRFQFFKRALNNRKNRLQMQRQMLMNQQFMLPPPPPPLPGPPPMYCCNGCCYDPYMSPPLMYGPPVPPPLLMPPYICVHIDSPTEYRFPPQTHTADYLFDEKSQVDDDSSEENSQSSYAGHRLTRSYSDISHERRPAITSSNSFIH